MGERKLQSSVSGIDLLTTDGQTQEIQQEVLASVYHFLRELSEVDLVTETS